MESEKLKISFPINDCIFHIRALRKHVVPDIVSVNYEETELVTKMHKHFIIEFQHVYEGSVFVRNNDIQGGIKKLSAGESCFIPPNVYHSVETSPDTVRYCFTLGVEYNKACVTTGFSSFFHYNYVINNITNVKFYNEKIIQTYMNQYREIISSDIYATSAQQNLLLALTVLYMLDCSYRDNMTNSYSYKSETNVADSNYDRQWIIENFISSRYCDDIKISDLSKLLYLSDRQTRTVVKKIMGNDYKKLIIKQRMEVANILIKETNLTLEEISQKVGYTSYSSFYAAYVKYSGFPPNIARLKSNDNDNASFKA